MKLIFLVSGGGGNLKFIHKVSKSLNLSINAVISDRPCEALRYAKTKNIPTEIRKFDRSKDDDALIINCLNGYNPDVIITNIHKIISERVLSKTNARFINLHYSLLPAYSGLIGITPLIKSIERKNQFSGITAHFVTKNVDQGNTITQGVFKIDEENVQMNFEVGCLVLLNAILSFSNPKVESYILYKNSSIISPCFMKINTSELKNIFYELQNSI